MQIIFFMQLRNSFQPALAIAGDKLPCDIEEKMLLAYRQYAEMEVPEKNRHTEDIGPDKNSQKNED